MLTWREGPQRPLLRDKQDQVHEEEEKQVHKLMSVGAHVSLGLQGAPTSRAKGGPWADGGRRGWRGGHERSSDEPYLQSEGGRFHPPEKGTCRF